MKRHVKRHAVQQPLEASYRLIPLTQGQNAIVDAEDFEWLSQWNWYAAWSPHTKSFYAVFRLKYDSRNTIRMHRLILGCDGREECDHINRETLDNRRHNLRKATRSENTRNSRKQANNTSGYTGVSYRKDGSKWAAYITSDKKRRHLGFYPTAKLAARAYDEAAKIHHREFAHLNFP